MHRATGFKKTKLRECEIGRVVIEGGRGYQRVLKVEPICLIRANNCRLNLHEEQAGGNDYRNLYFKHSTRNLKVYHLCRRKHNSPRQIIKKIMWTCNYIER